MFKFVQQLFASSTKPGNNPQPSSTPPIDKQPDRLEAAGAAAIDLPALMPEVNGFPLPDWHTILKWITTIPSEADQAQAWVRCEIAWLQRLQSALGAGYTIRTLDDVALLSSLDDVAARATLSHVSRSRQRVLHTLKGVAALKEWGYDILVVFDDQDSYYRYASNHYPDEGEFAFSSGMYLNAGCGHFIVVKNELLAIEPTIVHELTHACLTHLHIPAWLNEGLAVNTEHRFYPRSNGSHRGGHDAQLLHRRHQAFWGAPEIQQFWSGDSFTRTDDGNALSYDLASILTTQFATNWPQFTAFANAADLDDGGAQAAQKHLGLSLGRAVCALLELNYDAVFEPDPKRWQTEPQPGAF
ncbi:hypothetical protein LPB72_16910 [Hydrogenophaga crassostreae]|uniref:DUF1570 domain-containing protein n=1 Tax=Hydrogenophaga crassostreae TaxID=1763535 RepID=A0A162P2U0_9BURK|nr:hypothetical protein [Hydrogenophaga crassostreae]AOW12698.1 hypothetical protein LPB072_07430 [Hydrogenophaga crassostreae]OAD40570.1 hypothetical protein LPB72_16910 [Hydrogenophaga crassostreae]